MPKVKIDKGLYIKARKRAIELKYTSVNEYIVHMLEKELNTPTSPEENEEIVKRLKGLGYIS